MHACHSCAHLQGQAGADGFSTFGKCLGDIRDSDSVCPQVRNEHLSRALHVSDKGAGDKGTKHKSLRA